MKTIALVVLLLTLGLAAAGRWLPLGKEARAEVSSGALFRVVRGALPITIDENGYLTAKNNLEIKPKFKGQGTITWLIEEGKSIQPGELLVEFDKTQLENQVLELENSLVQFEIELEAARANLEIQERDNQAAIEKAELAQTMAALTLERYEQGEAPNELRKLILASEKASSELERAKERFQQVPELVEQGFLTRIQEEEERIRLREAEINRENADRELQLFETYTQSMELTKKRADVKDAERELENARKKADINLKERQAVVAQRERQVQSTRSRLEQQRLELSYSTIKAEKPGVVHYGDPSEPWSRDWIKVGNTVHQGTTLLTIPDLSEMQVLIQVHEADIDLIQEDMDVIVTVETRKEQSFPAKITEIASVASSANWTDETNKTFRVEVTLAATTVELRAGVTAKAEIQVETLEDVLYVPVHAVVAEGGRHLAFVDRAGEIEERLVKIGKNNSNQVEILEGLEEDEQVLLYDPRAGGEGGLGPRAEAAGPRAEEGREAEEPGTSPDGGAAPEPALSGIPVASE